MPLECPRCLLTNSDSTPTCECGHDLTPQIRKTTGATTVAFRRVERRVVDSGMTKKWFAVGMVAVWIILSYEGRLLHPCPKRTTLGITVVSAGLLFMSRWIAPGILAQHVVQMAITLGVAVFAYYAGCRGWLGKR